MALLGQPLPRVSTTTSQLRVDSSKTLSTLLKQERETNRQLSEDLEHTETTLRSAYSQINHLRETNRELTETSQALQTSTEGLQERVRIHDEAVRQTNRLMTASMAKSPLAQLIKSGADAQQNLFEVTVLAGKGQEEFSTEDQPGAAAQNLTFRIQNFNAPEKNVSIQNIPYQALEVPKIMPSANLERNLDFTVRLDSNYNVYWFMHRIFPADSFGNFDLNLYSKDSENYNCIIQVKALKPNPNIVITDTSENYQTSDGYQIVYTWTFWDCYLWRIPQLPLSYGNSGELSGVYSFKFGAMAEGKGDKALTRTRSLDPDDYFDLSTRESFLDSDSVSSVS